MPLSAFDAFFWKQAFIMTLPLLFAGVVHMAVVRLDVLPSLRIPLSLNAFGANKTWRGMLAMPILTVMGVWLAQQLDVSWATNLLHDHSTWLLGVTLGLGYVIPELPNSYVKRRMGIKPGETSPRSPWLFSLIDQLDSTIGCIIVYVLWDIGHVQLWIVLFFSSVVIKVIVNLLLWAMGLRRQPL